MSSRRPSPYRPIGVSLRDFARQRIRSYVPGGDLVNRSSLPPSWVQDAQTPLQWGETSAQLATPAPVAAPPAGSDQIARAIEAAETVNLPPELLLRQAEEAEWSGLRHILNRHQEVESEQAGEPTTAQAAAPAADVSRPAPPDAQRAPAQAGEVQPAPTRRRRGAVMDVTPPQPTGIFDERLWDDQPANAPRPTVDAPPSSEPENASSESPASLSPDVAEALARAESSSASTVQRRAAPPVPIGVTEAPPRPVVVPPLVPGVAEFEPGRMPPPVTAPPLEPVSTVSVPTPPHVQRVAADEEATVPAVGAPALSGEVEEALRRAETSSVPAPSAEPAVSVPASIAPPPDTMQRAVDTPPAEGTRTVPPRPTAETQPVKAIPPAPPASQATPTETAAPIAAPPQPAGQASQPAPQGVQSDPVLTEMIRRAEAPSVQRSPATEGASPSAAAASSSPVPPAAAVAPPSQSAAPAETAAPIAASPAVGQTSQPVLQGVQSDPELTDMIRRAEAPSVQRSPVAEGASSSAAPVSSSQVPPAVIAAPPPQPAAPAESGTPSAPPQSVGQASQPAPQSDLDLGLTEMIRRAEAPSVQRSPMPEGASPSAAPASSSQAPPAATAAPPPQPAAPAETAARSTPPQPAGQASQPAPQSVQNDLDPGLTEIIRRAEAPSAQRSSVPEGAAPSAVPPPQPAAPAETAAPSNPPQSVGQASQPAPQSVQNDLDPGLTDMIRRAEAPSVQRSPAPEAAAPSPAPPPQSAGPAPVKTPPAPVSAASSPSGAPIEPMNPPAASPLPAAQPDPAIADMIRRAEAPPAQQSPTPVLAALGAPEPEATRPMTPIQRAPAPAAADTQPTAPPAPEGAQSPFRPAEPPAAAKAVTAAAALSPDIAEAIRRAEAPTTHPSESMPASAATAPSITSTPPGVATVAPSSVQRAPDAQTPAAGSVQNGAGAEAIRRAEAPAPGAPAAVSPADAPTILEPAPPQGLSEAIQRAISAAEAPAPRPASAGANTAAAHTSTAASPRPTPVLLDSRLEPSPWAAFMKPPQQPPTPSGAQPGAPSVQRMAVPPPSVSTPPRTPQQEAAIQHAIAAAEAPALQEVDLYSALVAEGMVSPSGAGQAAQATAPSRPAPAAPPPVQRKPAAQQITNLPPEQLPPPSTVPQPGSVEAAMLEMLNLPPDTSVYGLKSPAEKPPAQRSAAQAEAPPLQRKPLDEALAEAEHPAAAEAGLVQRAVTIDEVSVSPSGENGGQSSNEPDIDDLARKVYRILRDRLRVERERSPR